MIALMTDLDYGAFEALTFDCYGTLIDWETGILAALRRVLSPRGIEASDDDLLEAYARSKRAAEAGPYRTLSRDPGRWHPRASPRPRAWSRTEREVAAFADSVGDWPAFPDSAAALARLHQRFRLGVITNCDDDLFARSAARLGIEFDWVVTAQQAGATSPTSAASSLRSSGSACRASGSCTSPRACSTTTSRPSVSACRPSGSTGATAGPEQAPRRPPDATP